MEPGIGVTLIVGLAVFLVGYAHGIYGVESRSTVGIVVWWTVALGVGLGLWSAVRLPRAAFLAGGLLAAFTLLTLVSASWASSAERAFDDFARDAVYVGVFTLVVLVSSRGQLGRWVDGIALGATAVALIGLASRLIPEVVHQESAYGSLPGDRTRLSQPIGYWNGLAVLTGIAVILLLRMSVTARSLVIRALAVAVLPALAGVIYLTSSRTSVFSASAGLLVVFILARRRWAILASLLPAALGSFAAVKLLIDRKELVDGPLGSSVAHTQGHEAALGIVLICALVGVVFAIGDIVIRPRVTITPRAQRALLVLGLAAVAATIAASNPVQRFDTFRNLSPEASAGAVGTGALRTHFFSVAGNGRWQLWTAAYHEFKSHPALGGGSGSFQSWWQRDRSFPLFVKDAHSMYFEVLAELGVVGLLLVVGFIGTGIASAVRRVLGSADRETFAALAGAFVAFGVALAADWMWELPGVALVGITLLALVTGRATAREDRERRLPRAAAPVVRSVVVAVALAAIALEGLPMLTHLKLDSSRAAVREDRLSDAIALALDAWALEPWASTPYLQLSLLQEDRGNLHAARAWIRASIARDRDDWLLWVIRARIETKSGQIKAARSSLAEARRLNPLETPPAGGPAG